MSCPIVKEAVALGGEGGIEGGGDGQLLVGLFKIAGAGEGFGKVEVQGRVVGHQEEGGLKTILGCGIIVCGEVRLTRCGERCGAGWRSESWSRMPAAWR